LNPSEGGFGCHKTAFSRQKRIFLKTKKADRKHCELLLLRLWSLLLVSVLLTQVFRAALPQVLLAVSVNLLRFAGNVSSSTRLAGALLRVELLHARS